MVQYIVQAITAPNMLVVNSSLAGGCGVFPLEFTEVACVVCGGWNCSGPNQLM